jgi:hypothetical protein
MTFREYLKGKSVAIVGPASTMNGTKQGDSIDNYDIVVRFNSALPIKEPTKEDVGTKTSILCNCLEPNNISGGTIDPVMWYREGVEWMLSPYPNELWYIKENYASFMKKNKDLKVECVNLPFFTKLENSLKTRPNSGLMGITYILSHEIKSMYITGISFGKGGYCKGYKEHISPERYNQLANSRIHKQEPQRVYFKNHVVIDPRVTVDAPLKNILST